MTPTERQQALEIEAYARRQEAIALEKSEDAPCSAEMHLKQAEYARVFKQMPRPDNWPHFNQWCIEQWEKP